jgi:hypothetical protein
MVNRLGGRRSNPTHPLRRQPCNDSLDPGLAFQNGLSVLSLLIRERTALMNPDAGVAG